MKHNLKTILSKARNKYHPEIFHEVTECIEELQQLPTIEDPDGNKWVRRDEVLGVEGEKTT